MYIYIIVAHEQTTIFFVLLYLYYVQEPHRTQGDVFGSVEFKNELQDKLTKVHVRPATYVQ